MTRAFIPIAAAATFAGVYVLTPSGGGAVPRQAAAEAEASVYYPGCNAVRAAGRAPLYRGQPGYRPEMDGDDDGIACEPHRGASAAGTAPVRMRLRAGRGRRGR
jgi:hypothetical protein